MKRILAIATILLGIVTSASGQEKPKVLVKGLKRPTAIAVGPGGKIFVADLGDPDKSDDGSVMIINKDQAATFATGLGNPRGMVAHMQWLFVADTKRILRIDANGKSDVFVPTSAFPKPPQMLGDMAVDQESGTLFVSDWGSGQDEGAIYQISPRGKVSVVGNANTYLAVKRPSALLLDGQSHLLATGMESGELFRIKLADGSTERLAEDLKLCHGLAWDKYGRLYVSGYLRSHVAVIPRPGTEPTELPQKIVFPGSICLDPGGENILVTSPDGITSVPINIPGHEVDETPLPLQPSVAFPDLQWDGWKPETDTGKANPLRPIVLTHANDASNRVFVATEHGVIHVFPNDQNATKTKVFLDITERVSYRDDQNEEGFLGLCFHPKYKENGEFFVFYTPKKTKNVNVLSRFRVSKDDPDRADPASEEELMRFNKPFWNHDGGTVCFGPDGYLYVTHGDGGAANDPFENGQNLTSLLGKIHRIDVDHKDAGKNYAIPKDNPFVDRKGAKPEIWAYGLRNVWRMAFDRKTGKLWAGDVGQNLYEEIDIIEKGGNYGWNRREGLHPFGPKGSGTKKEFIDPIWEYHHDVGKSITGGGVYRGPRLPELNGMYIYGDYVSGKIWALKYDESKGRVVANRPIKDRGMPMFSFGEDEKGEMYMLVPAPTGKGIYWFTK